MTSDLDLVAVFEPDTPPTPEQYTITVNAAPNEGGTTTGGNTYTADDPVTVTAEASEGYRFVHWIDAAGNAVSSESSYTFTADADRTLTAVFEEEPEEPTPEPQKYTVAVNAAEGGTVTGGGSYSEHTSITVTATPNSGYRFKGWQENGSLIDGADAHYTFSVSEARTLTAVFEKIETYTVSVRSTAGGTVSGGGVFEKGQTATLTATPGDGYRFLNWVDGDIEISTNETYSFAVNENKTITAVFELENTPEPTLTYNIEAVASPVAGGTVTGANTYEAGASVTISAAANAGYKFVNLMEDGGTVSTDASYTFTANGNRILTAVFESETPVSKPDCTISVSTNSEDYGSANGGGSYQEGEQVTISAFPNNGYRFKEWQLNGQQISTTASYTFTASTDQTFTAIFEKQSETSQITTYRITVNATEGGIANGGGLYVEGTQVTVTATASTGYQFKEWTENGGVVDTKTSFSFTADKDRTLTAVFEKKSAPPTPPTPVRYTVSVSASPAEGGTVSGGGSYQSGTSVEVAATPNDGYRFVRWTENGPEVSSEAHYAFDAAADRTLVAVFEKVEQPPVKTYSVSVSANPPAGGTVSGSGTFEENSAVTVTATANSNYRFTGWFESGNQVSASASYTFTVSADRTLVAEFTYSGGSTNTPSDKPGGNHSTGTTSTSQPPLPVSTNGTTSNMTTAASPNATIRGGTATSVITSAIAKEIIKQATANNSGEVVVAPVIKTGVTKAEITLPATVLSEIEQKTNAGLVISTPCADVNFQNNGLATLSSRQDVVVSTERTENTLELSITVGGQSVERIPGGLTLTAPVDHSTPGTVAVVVYEDGSREVIRKSVAGGNTITIPLDSPAKVEIIDNAKVFADVSADSWAANAVAFASGHELFSGTGSDIFSPNLPMTRGMLAMVLHNLENNPTQPVTGMFSDVVSDAWYSEAVSWAAARGIVSGYGNGRFGPGDYITREQLAVMLWRYAGKPSAVSKDLRFQDAGEASGYALEALRWATENGILNGKGGGILDPRGQATRAQVAQMLMNYLRK